MKNLIKKLSTQIGKVMFFANIFMFGMLSGVMAVEHFVPPSIQVSCKMPVPVTTYYTATDRIKNWIKELGNYAS